LQIRERNAAVDLRHARIETRVIRGGLETARGEADLAVCICTRGRPADLARALGSIAESSVPPAEVVVSDDGDEAATRQVVDGILPAARWVRGPRCGLGANRNRAIAAARSRYILFLDDDAELSGSFLATVDRCLAGQGGGAADRTIVTGRERRDGDLIGPAEQDFLGYQRLPYTEGAQLKTVVINSTIFPRTLFDTLRFDPRLYYGYDEVDITTRAVAAGYMIVECPAAVNLHHRSQLHRAEYDSHLDATRLYVTAKRRLFVERRRVAALVYLPLASLHMLVSGLRRDGLRGAASAFRAWRTGIGALYSFAQQRRVATGS
jgi:GT2 family glycosyltransferase